MAYAIYGLYRTGINDEYEANGEVHWYCSEHCAKNHSIAEGYRTSSNYSKPAINHEAIDGTQCEWCGITLRRVCARCHGKKNVYFGDADGNEHSIPCDCTMAPTSGSVEVWESLGM